eukprot:1095703-Rhodomonas_salina.2
MASGARGAYHIMGIAKKRMRTRNTKPGRTRGHVSAPSRVTRVFRQRGVRGAPSSSDMSSANTTSGLQRFQCQSFPKIPIWTPERQDAYQELENSAVILPYSPPGGAMPFLSDREAMPRLAQR